MADKMMRISGRGTDGTAKPISTDNNGNVYALSKPQESDIVRQTYDKIIDVIGAENISVFLPMWETSGTEFADLLNPLLKFTHNIAPANLGVDGVLHRVPRFSSGTMATQKAEVRNIVPTGSVAKLDSVTKKIAQKISNVPTSIGLIRVRVKKIGTITATTSIKVSIYTDAAGEPGVLVGTSATQLTGAYISTADSMRGFNWPQPLNITNEAYWIVFEVASGSEISGSNYIEFALGDGYENPSATYDGSAWSNNASPLVFDVFNDDITFPGDASFIVAANLTSQIGTHYAFGVGSLSTDAFTLSYTDKHNLTHNISGAGVGPIVIPKNIVGTDVVIGGTFSKSSSTNKRALYVGRKAIYADGNAGVSIDAPLHPLTIGSHIIYSSGSTFSWNGPLGPFILTKTTLTPSQMGDVVQLLYAKKRYGV